MMRKITRDKKSYNTTVLQESIKLQRELSPILSKYNDPNVVLTTLTRLLTSAVLMAHYVFPKVDPHAALEQIIDGLRRGFNEQLKDPRYKELLQKAMDEMQADEEKENNK